MRIECKTTFKDGADLFVAGDIRTVSDARGHAFIAHGWAAELGGDAAPAPPAASGTADLDIHDSALGLGDSNG
jgi:hypothetical protein